MGKLIHTRCCIGVELDAETILCSGGLESTGGGVGLNSKPALLLRGCVAEKD